MFTKPFKGVFVGIVAIGLVLSPLAAAPTHAQSSASLEAQIAALLAQVAALQAQLSGSTTTATPFTRDLTIGSTGADVTRLQQFLIARGHSIPAGATGYFGTQTRAAVASYQAANGITPVAGYFGPITRARVNTQLGPVTPGPTDPTQPDDDDELEGGAGSIDSYQLISNLNNEEVGEDEEDAEVAGLEIEVDDGSDIEITAVRLVFDEGTADEDFEDYAAEVSLWLDGDEVARVDADEFNDDNDWTSTVSLDDGAIIRRGDTGELVVAVTGARNIDSADIGDTWTVDFRQIRFMDAQGATISEDPSTAARTFSFESFATSADVELRIRESDDDINDSRTIDVDDNDDTEDVEVLSFSIEVRGDSDIELQSLPIEFTVTGAAHLDEMVSEIRLLMDGDEIGSENVPTDEETVVFDDLDVMLDAGDTYEFTVEVDFLSLNDALDEGDTLSATIGETETDSADFDAEDESGEELGDNDVTGSATGGPHAVFDAGISVTFVSASETVSTSDGADNDSGTFTIKYVVTSDDETIYVSDTPAATTASTIADATISGSGVLYSVEDDGTNSTEDVSAVVSWRRDSGNPSDSTNGVRLDPGEAAEFTLTMVRTNNGDADDDGLFRAALEAIGWNTDDSTTWNVFDFNLEDFRTDPIFLN